MTISEMNQLVNATATYQVKGTFKVNVRIVDVREVWGRTDVMIRPVDGTGELWVDVQSVVNVKPMTFAEYQDMQNAACARIAAA